MLHKIARKLLKRRTRHGPTGIQNVGHRQYVGGLWDEIGCLQFNFLVAQGLKPHHYLLDIACGSLRAGVHLIPYLQPGRYLGIDKEATLICAGIEHELGETLDTIKQPQFVVSNRFEFQRFKARPDFAIAQSLFTHLPPNQIRLCLANLRAVIDQSGRFYATFFQTPNPVTNPPVAHDHMNFRYTREEMERFGHETGWIADYIGDWGHPRSQVIIQYLPW